MFNVSPVYLENYNATDNIVINQGGTDCFDENTMVVTDSGSKKITQLSIGDKVLSYDEKECKEVYNNVKNVFRYNNYKKTIKVKLKNGKEIIATEDHEFYYEGGWHSLKYIVSLLNGNMEINTKL
jgi:hypothetical protein